MIDSTTGFPKTLSSASAAIHTSTVALADYDVSTIPPRLATR